MIPETRTSRCRRCGSGDIVQKGRNRYGNPQYPCKACGASGVLEPKGRSPEAPKEPMGWLWGGGPPGETAEAGWGLQWGGPEAASHPRVAETSRPAEGGDVLGVSGAEGPEGLDGRSATGRRPEAYRGGLWPTHPSGDKPSGSYRALASPGPSAVSPLWGEPWVSASRWLSMRGWLNYNLGLFDRHRLPYCLNWIEPGSGMDHSEVERRSWRMAWRSCWRRGSEGRFSSIFRMAYMTVVWCLPPKAWPISLREASR